LIEAGTFLAILLGTILGGRIPGTKPGSVVIKPGGRSRRPDEDEGRRPDGMPDVTMRRPDDRNGPTQPPRTKEEASDANIRAQLDQLYRIADDYLNEMARTTGGRLVRADNPHMLPSAEKFASRMQSLGLGDGNRFIVYDNSPLHSAARIWWMLKVYGAHYVAILDGGLQTWTAEGRPLEQGAQPHRHGHFTPMFDATAATEALEAAGIEVLDAREVIMLRLQQDLPGQLGALTRRMADAGVNIEVLYSDHNNQLILVVDDQVAGHAVAEAWAAEHTS
jgi:rhodanese-related sulfurtransferase